VIPAVYGLIKGWSLPATADVPSVGAEAEPVRLRHAAE
jgi:hypothetical protein